MLALIEGLGLRIVKISHNRPIVEAKIGTVCIATRVTLIKVMLSCSNKAIPF